MLFRKDQVSLSCGSPKPQLEEAIVGDGRVGRPIHPGEGSRLAQPLSETLWGSAGLTGPGAAVSGWGLCVPQQRAV